jgi:hypothetical protein
MRTDLVLDALRMALGLREPGAEFELVAHTDAGSQYTAEDYTQVLDDHEVLASIGTVRDALDNALAESLVDSYKTELIADRVWRSRAQLELATVEWVAWFNTIGCMRRSATSHHALARALESRLSGNGSVAALAQRLRTADNAPANGGRRRSRAPTADPVRERCGPRSAARSGRATGRSRMRGRPVASPTSRLRSITHRMKRENH